MNVVVHLFFYHYSSFLFFTQIKQKHYITHTHIANLWKNATIVWVRDVTISPSLSNYYGGYR